VVFDPTRVGVEEVLLKFVQGPQNCRCLPFEVRFPPPDESGVGLDLEEHPPRLDHERLESRYPHRLPRRFPAGRRRSGAILPGIVAR